MLYLTGNGNWNWAKFLCLFVGEDDDLLSKSKKKRIIYLNIRDDYETSLSQTEGEAEGDIGKVSEILKMKFTAYMYLLGTYFHS